MNSKSTEIHHPKECQDDPCRLIQVINIRIWLDFYEDDMSPWVLSSKRIQRENSTKPCTVLVVHLPSSEPAQPLSSVQMGLKARLIIQGTNRLRLHTYLASV
jgi:hypothetical protein